MSSCNPYPHDSFTVHYQKHEPSGFCLYPKALDGINTFFNPIVYTKHNDSEDISLIYCKKIEAVTKLLYNKYYKKSKPMKSKEEESQKYSTSKICDICEKDL